jgi:membrane protein implicated in regulation of membrane protease activity
VELVVYAAVVAAVAILVVVGVGRVIGRRRGPQTEFGAGGSPTVPIGTVGVAKTALSPSGVVLMAGEQWTATSGDRAAIAEGQRVRVTGQDGLTLIVMSEAVAAPAAE